jgi:hypothetical protein
MCNQVKNFLRINVPVKLLRSDDRDCGPGRLGPRVVALVVGFVVLWASVFAGLWRERLALYLLDRRFRRGRGYSWQIGTQTGSLDGIETTALSTELRQAGRGGTYTEFIVELRFRQPLEAVKIEGFRTEGDARELIAMLSRTLHVPFIDRTVEPTRQVDWNDVAKPLVDRASKSIGAFRQSRRYLLRLQPAGLNFHVPRFSRSSHSHVAIPRRSSAVARFCLDFRMDWIRDPW